MDITFKSFSQRYIGNIYKENSVDVDGKEFVVDIDLGDVSSIYANYSVGDRTFVDNVEVIDVEAKKIRVPFKTDVLSIGTNSFELVAIMKNGDVMPSATYKYIVSKSLDTGDGIQADSNYNILVSLINTVDENIAKIDKAIEDISPAIEGIQDQVDNIVTICSEEEIEINFPLKNDERGGLNEG